MQAEDRYAHLLQPIRDLASNWNVKIADELNEYLEALEQIEFTFEGGTSLNFAEAALVIQGSACVYSKKVEYLHTLVYQALEHIAQTKDGKQAGKARQRNRGDAGDLSEAEEEEHFLSLDDTLEEGTGLDLEDDEGLEEDYGPVRPPAALLALTAAPEAEGDLAGVRVHACSVHASGALLLDRSDGEGLGEDLRPHASCGMQPWHEVPEARAGSAEGQPFDYGQDDDVPEYGDEGWGDQGGPMEDPWDNAGGECVGEDAHPAQPVSDSRHAPEQRVLRSRTAQPAQPISTQAEEEVAVWDPYTPLDPDDASCLAAKPYRRFARVPAKPRRAKAPEPPRSLWQALERIAIEPGTLTFHEFAYALPRKAAAAASRRKDAPALGTQPVFEQPDWEGAGDDGPGVDDDGPADDGYEADDYAEAGNDDYETGFDPLAAGDEGAMDALFASAADAPAYAPAPAASSDQLSYEELCRRHVERLMAAAAAAQAQTELAGRVVTWRERVVPVLEEEDCRPPFDVHDRGDQLVAGFERLALDGAGGGGGEASGPATSRGKDKDELLATQPASFGFLLTSALGAAPPRYEVSRSFAALLQLINDGAIGIAKLDEADPTAFDLTLRQTARQRRSVKADGLEQLTDLVKGGEQQAPAPGQPNENRDPQRPASSPSQPEKAPAATKRRKGTARARAG